MYDVAAHALDKSYESRDVISSVRGRIDINLGFTVEKTVFFLLHRGRQWATVIAMRMLDLNHGIRLMTGA